MKNNFFSDRANYLKLVENFMYSNEIMMNETEFLRDILRNQGNVKLKEKTTAILKLFPKLVQLHEKI